MKRLAIFALSLLAGAVGAQAGWLDLNVSGGVSPLDSVGGWTLSNTVAKTTYTAVVGNQTPSTDTDFMIYDINGNGNTIFRMQNSASGVSTGDGLAVQLGSSAEQYRFQYESQPVYEYTANTLRGTWGATGGLTVWSGVLLASGTSGTASIKAFDGDTSVQMLPDDSSGNNARAQEKYFVDGVEKWAIGPNIQQTGAMDFQFRGVSANYALNIATNGVVYPFSQTSTQIDALVPRAAGGIIYNSTLNDMCFSTGTAAGAFRKYSSNVACR
jgi:hypothetical protein